MKEATQKIKVEIEAEVPVGDSCNDCEKLFVHGICMLFDSKLEVKGGGDSVGKTPDTRVSLKCQACLDACEAGKGS